MSSAAIPWSSAGGLVLLGFLAAPEASSQPRPDAAPLAFEVASVKIAPSGVNGVRGGCHGIDSVYSSKQLAEAPPLGRCVITDARLSHLIGIAYGLPNVLSVKSGPEWIARGDLRFNVEAKAEDPSKATKKQLLIMLQTMLADRFQLKFHYETTEMAGFALSATKGGPKLHTSTSEDAALSFTGSDGEVAPRPFGGQPIRMTARKYSIAMLVNVLSLIGTSGPVIDKTGLAGEYDFTLSWDEDAGPVLSTALREQLGLRLVSEKVPVSVLVVDSAQKPTAN